MIVVGKITLGLVLVWGVVVALLTQPIGWEVVAYGPSSLPAAANNSPNGRYWVWVDESGAACLHDTQTDTLRCDNHAFPPDSSNQWVGFPSDDGQLMFATVALAGGGRQRWVYDVAAATMRHVRPMDDGLGEWWQDYFTDAVYVFASAGRSTDGTTSLSLYRIEAGNDTPIVHFSVAWRQPIRAAAFSPDGGTLAMLLYPDNDQTRLGLAGTVWLLDVATGDLSELTVKTPSLQRPFTTSDALVWSDDGSLSLAVSQFFGDRRTAQSLGVLSVNLATGEETYRELISRVPNWQRVAGQFSPDGRYYIFSSARLLEGETVPSQRAYTYSVVVNAIDTPITAGSVILPVATEPATLCADDVRVVRLADDRATHPYMVNLLVPCPYLPNAGID